MIQSCKNLVTDGWTNRQTLGQTGRQRVIPQDAVRLTSSLQKSSSNEKSKYIMAARKLKEINIKDHNYYYWDD